MLDSNVKSGWILDSDFEMGQFLNNPLLLPDNDEVHALYVCHKIHTIPTWPMRALTCSFVTLQLHTLNC